MSGLFKAAVREKVNLLIGLVGCSGSGKTMSAMKLASGIVGKGNRFAVIDTEARRSLHYAEMFDFDMCELNEPFTPDAYLTAIQAAEKEGYKVIVVDSLSHEWAGPGGILEMAEAELQRMAGDNYQKREACKMSSWVKPKMAHKHMIQRLLQCKATLILCFRAEEKVRMDKDDKGKIVIVPIGWQPICSKEIPYDLTVSFLMTPDAPGMPKPLKLQEQHRKIFPLDKPINEESGKRVAEWAAGGVTAPPAQAPPFDAGNLDDLYRLVAELATKRGTDDNAVITDITKGKYTIVTGIEDMDGKTHARFRQLLVKALDETP